MSVSFLAISTIDNLTLTLVNSFFSKVCYNKRVSLIITTIKPVPSQGEKVCWVNLNIV